MTKQTFSERLEELPQIVEMSWSQIQRYTGINVKQMNEHHHCPFSSVEKVALRLDLIPIVLFNSAGTIETAGQYELLLKNKADNYLGKVFNQARVEQDIALYELEIMSQIPIARLISYEAGKRKPTVAIIDAIATQLSLQAHYFVIQNEIMELCRR